MNSQNDWDISARAPACNECGSEFVDLQPCHTALRFEPDGYRRIDLCGNCFRERPEGGDDVRGYWKSVYRTPPPPRKKVSREDVESLLRALVEKGDPASGPMIYVLAVMLERKRILIERSVQRRPDGKRLYVYEHRRDGDTFLVADPELRIDAIDGLEREVAEKLRNPS